MSDRDRVLRKIKKLFAMANDVGSPEEAVIAARQARALMDKHDVAQYEVEQFRGDNKFGEVRNDRAYKYTPKWLWFLAVDVGRWNDVQIRRERDYSEGGWEYGGHPKVTIKFSGLEADAITAKVMFEYLRDTITRLAGEQGYGSNAKKLNAFKMGAACEVIDRIRDLVKQRQEDLQKSTGTDLMVVKNQLVEAEFGVQTFKPEAPKIGDHDAYFEGQVAGAGINLHTQVQGGDAPVGIE